MAEDYPINDHRIDHTKLGIRYEDGEARITIATVTKTAAYTAVASDKVILCDATGGAFTVTLPAVASSAKLLFHIKKIDGSANAITVDGNGAETIDDSATHSLSSQYNSITIVCDGTEWWKL